jgi:hypothetical protein
MTQTLDSSKDAVQSDMIFKKALTPPMRPPMGFEGEA